MPFYPQMTRREYAYSGQWIYPACIPFGEYRFDLDVDAIEQALGISHNAAEAVFQNLVLLDVLRIDFNSGVDIRFSGPGGAVVTLYRYDPRH
jgi:hypothetical protein